MKIYSYKELKKIEDRHWKDGFKYYRTHKKSKTYDEDRKAIDCVALALFAGFNMIDTTFPSSHDYLMNNIALTFQDNGCFEVSYIDDGKECTYSSQYKIAEYFSLNKKMPPEGSWYYL